MPSIVFQMVKQDHAYKTHEVFNNNCDYLISYFQLILEEKIPFLQIGKQRSVRLTSEPEVTRTVSGKAWNEGRVTLTAL